MVRCASDDESEIETLYAKEVRLPMLDDWGASP